MINVDAKNHVTGRSIYLDDLPLLEGTLHALTYDSEIAHGKIISCDYQAALDLPGVVRILTHADIPGENEIGGIIKDEPCLAKDEIHFCGMPILLIIAESEFIARKARKLIKVEYQEERAIVDPREARAKGHLIAPPRTFSMGDTSGTWANCAHIFEGTVETNGQEHLYIETQGAYAYPTENGSIRISSSTQGPTAVQKTVATVLDLPMHKIEVDVTRLGGGFGGKEDQATLWAVLCALGVTILNRPVKFAVHRMDDMRMTGKRHPYSSDFKIGFSKDLKILAYEASFHQNAGAAADLSTAILERTLFHATNAYYIPNVEVTAYSCRTNLPPNTAFRGFGGPQGMFVIEAALAKAAKALNTSASKLQELNLHDNGQYFSYGQEVQGSQAKSTWEDCTVNYDLEKTEKEIAAFNAKSTFLKKGVAMMPICFGISFTNTPMNHARALVHVYQDGSVGVSTGGVEMGQGLNTKMIQVAAEIFSINPDRIKIETTNTTRVANTSPSAASATADLNGKALEKACLEIAHRLKFQYAEERKIELSCISLNNEELHVNGESAHISWEEIVQKAFWSRICLSEQGHYATPLIHYDKTKEKGHPFAYHVYGTAIVTTTVDCIRGRYTIDAVKITHDFGISMNRAIDHGQIEGGLVQGLGWMTMEELVYNEKGQLKSNALSTYKIPDIYSVPAEISIRHLDYEGHELAIKKSKAVGEPPLMYGIGAYFAIQNAIAAFNPNHVMKFDAPYTPEKVLMDLYEDQAVLNFVKDKNKLIEKNS